MVLYHRLMYLYVHKSYTKITILELGVYMVVCHYTQYTRQIRFELLQETVNLRVNEKKIKFYS